MPLDHDKLADVGAELRRANISDTREMELVDDRQVVRRDDGSVFFLDTLSMEAYWTYMSHREHAWYEAPNEGYKG